MIVSDASGNFVLVPCTGPKRVLQFQFNTATGKLAEHPPLEWSGGAAVTVVIAADGYPGKPRTGSSGGNVRAPDVACAADLLLSL